MCAMVDVGIKAKFIPVEQEKEPERWLELRTCGIGGSDAGAILGLNKYSSPLTVYMQKKGVEGFRGNAATEWGHILEDPIRQKAIKELGIDICAVPGMYVSEENSFMFANLDGLCHANQEITIKGETVSGFGGHEIKTSTNGDGFTEDEIPDSYYCQVQHYMAVTGLDWFILTVFILNSKTGKHYVIRRNDDFIYTKLIPAEKDFWENFILADKIPEPIGVESEEVYIRNLKFDSEIELDEDTQKLIAQKMEIDKQIKVLESDSSVLKSQILINLSKLSIGFEKADKVLAKGGNYRLTYNTQIRKSLDSTLLKEDGLYDKYCKESESKVMRLSEVK